MGMRKHVAVTLSALVFASGSALTSAPAIASTSVINNSGEFSNNNSPTACYWVHGHWRHSHRGRAVWIPGHRVCHHGGRGGHHGGRGGHGGHHGGHGGHHG